MSVVAVKITSLQRCVSRARQAREKAGEAFGTNFDLQDAAVLNVVRACAPWSGGDLDDLLAFAQIAGRLLGAVA